MVGGVAASFRMWNGLYLNHYPLINLCPGCFMSLSSANELVVFVPAHALRFFLAILRNGPTAYFSLMDITAIDYLSRVKRFELQYVLLSVLSNLRVVVKTAVSTNEVLDSISDLFPSAAWLEREIWDLFGIFFLGHFDLRRILTDYGFEGYPLRKDYPLSGFLELRYDEALKRIVAEPLELTQSYRVFDFKNPWV